MITNFNFGPCREPQGHHQHYLLMINKVDQIAWWVITSFVSDLPRIQQGETRLQYLLAQRLRKRCLCQRFHGNGLKKGISSLPQALLQKEELVYKRGRREGPEGSNFWGAPHFLLPKTWCWRAESWYFNQLWGSHHVCSPATVTNCQRFAQNAEKKNPRSRPW